MHLSHSHFIRIKRSDQSPEAIECEVRIDPGEAGHRICSQTCIRSPGRRASAIVLVGMHQQSRGSRHRSKLKEFIFHLELDGKEFDVLWKHDDYLGKMVKLEGFYLKTTQVDLSYWGKSITPVEIGGHWYVGWG